jgi:hypothetical protein
MNRTDADVLPGVTFKVERFEWTADDRLALVGRWFGLRGHRFLRPTLDVDVSGERRRMLADLEHKPWAAEEGEEWIAEFRWRGEPVHFQDAELTVSPDLAVQLPQPANGVAEAAEPALGDRVPARPPRTVLLEAELAAAAEELARVTGELTKLRDQQTEAAQAASAELERLKAERDEAAAAHAQALGAVQRERDEAAAAHAQALGAVQRERDQAHEELATVERERDEARARLAAAEAETHAAAEARDEARAERNAWMSRARAATLPPAPGTEADPPESPAGTEAGAPAPPARADSGAGSDPSVPAPGAPSGPAAGPDPSVPAPGRPSGPRPEREPPAGSAAERHRPKPRPSDPLEPAPAERDTPPLAAPPTPPRERRTIRIGERPFPAPPGPVGDPLNRAGWRRVLDAWGPRLAALAALIVILAVAALVLSLAL